MLFSMFGFLVRHIAPLVLLVVAACGGVELQQGFVRPRAKDVLLNPDARLAVLDFRGDASFARTLTESIAIRLSSSGLHVVDRSELRLAAERQETSVYGDTTDVTAVVKRTNRVDVLVSGAIDIDFHVMNRIGNGRVTFKLLEVSSGDTLMSQAIRITNRFGGNDIEEVAGLIARHILKAAGRTSTPR